MHSNSVRILVKEKENKEREYVVSKKDAELSELLTGTINDYPDDPFVQLTDVEEKTIERDNARKRKVQNSSDDIFGD